MDIGVMNQYLARGELFTAGLITCRFDPVAFSNIEPYIGEDMVSLAKQLMKFKAHLSSQPTDMLELSKKLTMLERRTSSYVGKATIPYTWSGVHLKDSDSFYGTAHKPVSVNQMDYVIKPTWGLQTLNSDFQETVDNYKGQQVFICNNNFDLTSLKDKVEVKKVVDNTIYLKGNIEIPIVIVS